ncbi:hypothetical protein GGR53DRAFT_511329 [Hypoxylon sp. FL1150]|nr:hypothetical protein GGR53DRAFT_511329 [Hypoxylon sp. FL1150]
MANIFFYTTCTPKAHANRLYAFHLYYLFVWYYRAVRLVIYRKFRLLDSAADIIGTRYFFTFFMLNNFCQTGFFHAVLLGPQTRFLMPIEDFRLTHY